MPGLVPTPDYVIFWTNVFDWVGGVPVIRLTRSHAMDARVEAVEELPGVSVNGGTYRRSDGALEHSMQRRYFAPLQLPTGKNNYRTCVSNSLEQNYHPNYLSWP